MGRFSIAGVAITCLAALGSACTSAHSPELVATAAAWRCERPATDTPVAIALSKELREFVFVGSLHGDDVSYAFGPAAHAPLTALLASCFGEGAVESVAADRVSVVQAAEYFGPGSEYVGVVRFNRVSTTVTRKRMFVEVGLELELMSRDSRVSFALDGDGTGHAPLYRSDVLRVAGRDALEQTLESLRDRIEEWAVLLEPSSSRGRSPTR
jgi:hypothetical protein